MFCCNNMTLLLHAMQLLILYISGGSRKTHLHLNNSLASRLCRVYKNPWKHSFTLPRLVEVNSAAMIELLNILE